MLKYCREHLMAIGGDFIHFGLKYVKHYNILLS